MPDLGEEESQDGVAPVPTRAGAGALPEPGEESPGSCRDRVAAPVRDADRASAALGALSTVQTAPPGCEALPAVLNARAALWRCPRS